VGSKQVGTGFPCRCRSLIPRSISAFGSISSWRKTWWLRDSVSSSSGSCFRCCAGSLRFLALYFLGGIAAAALHTFVDPLSTVPSLGASGAISAVLGSYRVLFPGARVFTLVPIFLFPFVVDVPALVWLGYWFLQQSLNGLASLRIRMPGSGVAWWAHVGGFLFGLVVTLPMRWLGDAPARADKRRRQQLYYGYDREWPFG
jgi:Rhomboid family